MSIHDAVNDAVTRTAAIASLGGIALIHALQSPEAFEEATYLGLLFIVAVVASVALAAIMTRTSDQRTWSAACALPALILLGYVLSRTSGLPGATADVDNWTEPLGLASLVTESLLVCLTAGVLVTRRQPAGSRIETRERYAPGSAAPTA